MMRIRRSTGITPAGSLLVWMLWSVALGCTAGGDGDGKTKLDFLIDWQAEPTYLGIYYAKSQGLFSRAGLDVTIVQSWGANQAVTAVSSGAYSIATASGGATVMGRANGADVVSLAVLYPTIPSVVYGLASKKVSTPADLYGKRIGVYPGSVTVHEFEAFLREQHLDRSKIEVVSLSGADIPLVLSDRVDGVLHYTEMSPVQLELDTSLPQVGGRRTYELHLAQLGVKGYGLNVVTSAKELAGERGKVLIAANAALLEGYRLGCSEQEKAAASFVEEFPEKDLSYVLESWSRVCEIIGKTPGHQSVEGWRETIELYETLGLLPHPVSAEAILR